MQNRQSVYKSRVRRGVRDWTVWAAGRENSDKVQMMMRLSEVNIQNASITIGDWPELEADQHKLVLDAIGADSGAGGYALALRLADEARKAVAEVIALMPKKEAARQPWQVRRLEFQEERALRAGRVLILNGRDGERHERAVRYALLQGLPVPPTVLKDYAHIDADYLSGFIHHLRFKDNGQQVFFDDEAYTLLCPYITRDDVRYGGPWYLYSTQDMLLVPDPDNIQGYIADRSLKEVVTIAEAWLGIRILLEQAPAGFPDKYPLHPSVLLGEEQTCNEVPAVQLSLF